MTKLQLERNQWFEAKRHNEAMEAEAARHNVESESISREMNENTRRANEETARANRAREALTAEAQAEAARSNLAREAETLRHNSSAEKIDTFTTLTNNQREWEKLTLTQQRNKVQNALDAATSNLRKVESLVKRNEAKANVPDAQRAKFLADIEMAKRELSQRQREFSINNVQKEKSLSLEEKRTEAEQLKAAGSFLSDITKSVGNIIDSIATVAKIK
jgi:chromosome segregation ATPase